MACLFAALLRRLADRMDGLRVVWSLEYIKEHPSLTEAEMREVLGKAIITTRGRADLTSPHGCNGQ
jgi:hypothetical protein